MPQIRTFCRIKPTAEYYPDFEVSHDTLSLRVPELLRDYNNPKAPNRTSIHHEFHFNYIFKNVATQEEVFNVAAKDIVEAFLDGYNGTIFAYGQTGTGKTFTVEGYSKSHNMRGLEPRALSMVYKALEKRTDEEINVHISYMEIYQEVGYDLLNPNSKNVTPNTPFPKVHVLESTGGVWVVRNLSVHQAPSEEAAINLLSRGQIHRKVAATNVHDRSSRSHAVFTIQLTAKKPGSDTIVRSKLHLVDLAGSERVSKTGVQGHQLNEAKCINLSLHYLETVIISLQGKSAPPSRQRPSSSSGNQRSRNNLPNRPSTAEGTRAGNISKHVPYRNSLLTMVLRDSLGGNCMTSMIATISLELENLGESISTCRFAGRVACIANTVSGRIWRNEQLDEKQLIKKLKKKVAELETELSCLKLAKEVGNAALDSMNTKLTDEDKIMCSEIIQGYLGGKVVDPITAGITNPQKFRECMKLLKSMIKEGQYLNAEFSDSRGIENGTAERNWKPTENHLNKRNIRTIVHNPANNNRRAIQDKKALTSNDNPDVDILKIHHNNDKKYQQTHKEVEIPISNAWTADTTETAPPKQPIRRKPRPVQREEPVEEPLPEDPIRRLAAILDVHKKRSRKYESPFERKKLKEIKHLNTKVEQMNQAKLEKEEELLEMKLSLATQELNIMEQELKANLEVTKDQVSDQHAYVQQLKSTEADPNLVEQEKLVEKQLRKRQEKFDKKLEIIEEKRHHLNEESHQIRSELSTAKPSIVDKFGKFRKHDGTLNTRQVFDLLKNEEKKQERVQTELDREKYMVLSKQLEMKELATRQKLQEFKEILRMSKSAGYPEGLVLHNGDRNMNTAPAKSSFYPREPSRHASRHSTKPVHIVEQEEENMPESRASEDTYVTAKSDFDREEDERDEYPKSAVTRVSGATFFTAKSAFDRPPSRSSIRSFQSSIPDSDFYAKKRLEKDPTVRWESAFSRPQSSAASRPASVADLHNDLKRSTEKEVQFLPPEYMTDDYKSSSRKSQKKRDVSSDRESEPEETMLPSNYVYNMSRGEKFDGRKMGLTSTNFDSALASMLEKSNDNVYYDHDDYNEFARNTNPSFFGEAPQSRKSRDSSRKSQIQAAYGVRQSRSRERRSNFSRDSWLRQSSHSRDRKSTSRDRNKGSRWRDRSVDSDYSDKESKPVPIKPKTPNYKFRNWGPMARETSILDRLASTTIKTPEKKSRQNQEKPKQESNFDDMVVGHTMKMEYVPKKPNHVHSTTNKTNYTEENNKGKEVEDVFQSKVQSHKDRVAKIRKARNSAELIQRAWRNYVKKKNRKKMRS